MAQAKARHPEFPGRFFNIGFIISPEGDIILRHHKVVPLLPVEHSVTPHNVWDKWIELYGRNLDAFYPVVDTEIGLLRVPDGQRGLVPGERPRPGDERRRGGLPRGPYPHPHVGNGRYTLQFRWEMFNAFNHPSFSTPNATNQIGTNGTNTGGIEGTITSIFGAPRIMQGALKLTF